MNLYLARDALKFARENRSIYDYRQFTLRTKGAGTSARDRQRVLDKLIENGTVIVEDETLRISRNADWAWLQVPIQSGDPEVWEIVDDFVPAKHLELLEDGVLAEIGAVGESAVIEELRSSLTAADFARVKHVSIFDDSAGYDISAPATRSPNTTRMLEVKTSTRGGKWFRFFLSRNEFVKGSSHDAWSLVFVRIESGEPRILGHLYLAYFEDEIPREVSRNFQSNGFEIRVDTKQILPGLP